MYEYACPGIVPVQIPEAAWQAWEDECWAEDFLGEPVGTRG